MGGASSICFLFLFLKDPRFQGPTEPRTPLGPPPACSATGEELCLPATSMQLSWAEGPGLPAIPSLAATTSPTACLHAQARTKHTPPRSQALVPSALSTASAPSLGAQLGEQESWTL